MFGWSCLGRVNLTQNLVEAQSVVWASGHLCRRALMEAAQGLRCRVSGSGAPVDLVLSMAQFPFSSTAVFHICDERTGLAGSGQAAAGWPSLQAEPLRPPLITAQINKASSSPLSHNAIIKPLFNPVTTATSPTDSIFSSSPPKVLDKSDVQLELANCPSCLPRTTICCQRPPLATSFLSPNKVWLSTIRWVSPGGKVKLTLMFCIVFSVEQSQRDIRKTKALKRVGRTIGCPEQRNSLTLSPLS